MIQPDLFEPRERTEQRPETHPEALDMPGLLERLTAVCERPRYSFMVLNLILQASGGTGTAGPFVGAGRQRVLIRDWLCDALRPVARRDPRRIGIAARVRRELDERGGLEACDEPTIEGMVEAEVDRRIRLSGRTAVSRSVSELVRAGLVRRHYQGYRVDHHNRGARRNAVYTVTEEARRALSAGRRT